MLHSDEWNSWKNRKWLIDFFGGDWLGPLLMDVLTEVRITYLRAVRSKSLSASGVTQERRTSTAS